MLKHNAGSNISEEVDGISSACSTSFLTRIRRGVFFDSCGLKGKFSVGMLPVWRVFLELGLSGSTNVISNTHISTIISKVGNTEDHLFTDLTSHL